jgi:hypothetical protein
VRQYSRRNRTKEKGKGKASASASEREEKMDQEFEEFFQYLEKMTSEEEIKKILKPLKYLMWRQQLKKGIKIALILISICFAVYYVESLNWLFCGIGRLLMIKILPVWDWRYLGKAKCLIEKSQVQPSSSSSSASYSSDNTARDELVSRDCRVCENFGRVYLQFRPLVVPIRAHSCLLLFLFFSQSTLTL